MAKEAFANKPGSTKIVTAGTYSIPAEQCTTETFKNKTATHNITVYASVLHASYKNS